jgi:peptide/nickel transport system permease protein
VADTGPAPAGSSGGGLRHYVLVRLALAPLFLFVILTVLFVLLRVAPGDPVTASLGGRASPAQIERAREASGLNDPLVKQYVDYLSGVVRGDFGDPYTDPRSVTQIISDRFPATVELTVFAMTLAVTIGVLMGARSARKRDGPFDVSSRLFAVISYAAPVFWLGILAQLVFAVKLGWLPTGNRVSADVPVADLDTTGYYLVDAVIHRNWSFFVDAFEHLILPGVTLGLVISGVFIRMVRVNMLQTLRSDYVESARARGINERHVVYRHAFRNALIPVITIMGLQFSLLLGGAVLTETTFSWPGLGSALVDFLNARDYAAVQGIVTFFAVIVIVVSLAIDIINGLIDPRVRY